MKVFADKKVIDKRWQTCAKCEHLTSFTKQCKKCGCFMKLKTKIKNVSCPDKPPRW
jgi:hypothetical protein